jgi:hypothetical protein
LSVKAKESHLVFVLIVEKTSNCLVLLGKKTVENFDVIVVNTSKGKNFSCNNVDGKRRKNDFYATPYSLTRLLLDRVKLNGSILEPACGDGAIVKVLKEREYELTSYDIEVDFFTENRKFNTIITNPPFSIANDFIKKAREISNEFYFLLPLSYLHGKARHDTIFHNTSHPLERVFIFTRYPMLGEALREDGKHNTGMMVYAWYKFTKDYQGKPEIEWLDNDPFILKKGE